MDSSAQPNVLVLLIQLGAQDEMDRASLIDVAAYLTDVMKNACREPWDIRVLAERDAICEEDLSDGTRLVVYMNFPPDRDYSDLNVGWGDSLIGSPSHEYRASFQNLASLLVFRPDAYVHVTVDVAEEVVSTSSLRALQPGRVAVLRGDGRPPAQRVQNRLSDCGLHLSWILHESKPTDFFFCNFDYRHGMVVCEQEDSFGEDVAAFLTEAFGGKVNMRLQVLHDLALATKTVSAITADVVCVIDIPGFGLRKAVALASENPRMGLLYITSNRQEQCEFPSNFIHFFLSAHQSVDGNEIVQAFARAVNIRPSDATHDSILASFCYSFYSDLQKGRSFGPLYRSFVKEQHILFAEMATHKRCRMVAVPTTVADTDMILSVLPYLSEFSLLTFLGDGGPQNESEEPVTQRTVRIHGLWFTEDDAYGFATPSGWQELIATRSEYCRTGNVQIVPAPNAICVGPHNFQRHAPQLESVFASGERDQVWVVIPPAALLPTVAIGAQLLLGARGCDLLPKESADIAFQLPHLVSDSPQELARLFQDVYPSVSVLHKRLTSVPVAELAHDRSHHVEVLRRDISDGIRELSSNLSLKTRKMALRTGKVEIQEVPVRVKLIGPVRDGEQSGTTVSSNAGIQAQVDAYLGELHPRPGLLWMVGE